MALKIDSHHHFWNYSPREYGWINESMAVLRRDFGPADLKAALTLAGVDLAVSVQARQTAEETEFLLAHAEKEPFLAGVVGWAPLAGPNAEATLDRWKSRKKLKGLRHVVQDEPDDNFILGAAFNRGIRLLKNYNWTYDILIFERHLPQAIKFVDQHPNQVFILDHIAKPKIKAGEREPWAANIRELAKRPNVYCKISGMVTEADWNRWTPESLRPYIDTVLEAFTPRRLMFGSDWPVMLLACPYAHWFEIVSTAIAPLSESERDRILGLTAIEAYKL